MIKTVTCKINMHHKFHWLSWKRRSLLDLLWIHGQSIRPFWSFPKGLRNVFLPPLMEDRNNSRVAKQ